MKLFQIGKQIKTQRHVTGSDLDLPQFQIQHLPEFLFPQCNLFIPLRHITIEQFPLPRQPHAFRRSGKKLRAKRRFQLPDRLADGRLGNIQFFPGQGQVPCSRNMIEYFIIFQVVHSLHNSNFLTSDYRYVHTTINISCIVLR